MIGSNNYLGLAQDPRVVEAAVEATRKFGAGCTGSRLLNGTISLHNQLEEALADFLHRESVLLFSTGFFANQGALAALTESEDLIFCDRENHASIIEGCQVAPGKLIPYRHNSVDALRNRLKRAPEDAGRLIIMDGVFSMSGDIADLPPMIEAAKEYGAVMYVDEAHSLGVVGLASTLARSMGMAVGSFSPTGGVLASSRARLRPAGPATAAILRRPSPTMSPWETGLFSAAWAC
jgi:8-amino-7-oxononanoate synthase